jgi:DNA-binding LacI/PurR family transcriptional regulator
MNTKSTNPVGSRRVTIKDVAAALNVAVSTVSNAYNRPDQLSAALRERVFETADRIGYPGPNPIARGLRKGNSGLIAILLGQPLAAAFADPVTAATLEGITGGLSESGRHGVVLVPEEAAGGLPASDGVIALCPDRDDHLLGQVIRHGLPIVIVDHPQQGFLTSISVDDEMAARGAIGHVTGLGHNQIAIIVDGLLSGEDPGFVTGNRQAKTANSRTSARLRGYKAGAEAAGLKWADVPVYAAGADSVEAGQVAGDAVLGEAPKVTAILCATDRLAVGVLAAAKTREIRVPDRLSVVGFDDTPAARTANPPLTSVRQPHAAKGRAAAMSLLAQLHDEPTPAVGRLAPKLVVRGSSAAPAGS